MLKLENNLSFPAEDSSGFCSDLHYSVLWMIDKSVKTPSFLHKMQQPHTIKAFAQHFLY